MRRKVQHVSGRTDALYAVDDVQHATALDNRHLLVLVRVDRRHYSGLNRQPADHQLFADDHLTCNPVGHVLGGDGLPIHFFPLSRPDPPAANSGCTLTTPNSRSSSSRVAAIIQRKLICPPGAATFGW